MNAPVQKLNIKGLIVATYTPFKPDNTDELDLSLIPAYAAHLARNNVKGVFVNGTTGESVSLSLKERMQVLEAWSQVAAKHNLKVIAMVGTNSAKDSQNLARHAASLNVDAISCMAPSFFKPATMQALVGFIKRVADSVPNTPFYYYHMPSSTNLHGTQAVDWNMFDMILYIEQNKLIPNFVGLKYTGMYGTKMSFPDIMNITEYKNGKYEVFGGRDEMVLQLLVSGVKAFVGLSYNFAAKLYYDLIAAFEARNVDKCRQLQRLTHRLSEADMKVSAGQWGHKYMFCLAGCNVGDVRTPNVQLTRQDRDRVEQALIEFNAKCSGSGYDVFQTPQRSAL